MPGSYKLSLYDMITCGFDLSDADSHRGSEIERSIDMTLTLVAGNRRVSVSKAGYDLVKKVVASGRTSFGYGELSKLAGGEKYVAVAMQSAIGLGVVARADGRVIGFDFGPLRALEFDDYYSFGNRSAASNMPYYA